MVLAQGVEPEPWDLKPVDFVGQGVSAAPGCVRACHDNPYLLPGEFVIASDGRIVLAYRYQYCSNYPDVDVLIDSIKEADASVATAG